MSAFRITNRLLPPYQAAPETIYMAADALEEMYVALRVIASASPDNAQSVIAQQTLRRVDNLEKED